VLQYMDSLVALRMIDQKVDAAAGSVTAGAIIEPVYARRQIMYTRKVTFAATAVCQTSPL
jgi:hypothetical protein